MANTDEKVMEMVVDELRKEPDVETSTLHDRVKSVFPHIGKLTLRQFNARYPLQIKRRESMAAGKKKTAKKTSKKTAKKTAKKTPKKTAKKTRRSRKTQKTAEPAAKAPKTRKTRKTRKRSPSRARKAPASAPAGTGRDAVRHVLLGFAADLSAAEDRSQVVRVLADVDAYVGRLMDAATS